MTEQFVEVRCHACGVGAWKRVGEGAVCPGCGQMMSAAVPVAPVPQAPMGWQAMGWQAPVVKVGRSRGSIVVVVAGVLVALAAFMPWVSITTPFGGSIERSGMQGGDGTIVVVLGVIAALTALADRPTVVMRGLWIVVGLIAVAVGVYDIVEVQERIASLDEDVRHLASVGFGLYALVAGGVGVIVGGAMTPPRR